ncbi:hypothetical protein [Methanolobus sp.]|jgi:hypothetical protein|uniref:hypothetical protein n=1 Tax=Methanolobus sp. TaxID=1874737 RepID=UPI0025F7A253|nr:hypothetical protein [Methanolobus sp.]
MIKKVFLVLIISILMLSISGCTDKAIKETPAETDLTTNTSEIHTIPDDSGSLSLVPADNLPESYEFLGSRELSIEKIEGEYISVPGIIDGSEGLYTYLDSTDVYVDVIEMNSSVSAEEFIAEFKAGFREYPDGGRFTEVSFNGHSAVRILEYILIDTNDVKRYTYIWNNDKFVFVVGGATDDYAVLSNLAEATGY